MLVKKPQTEGHKNSPDCTVWEYDHQSDEISLATVLINGRYPKEKRVTNLECEEMLYAISGSGTIHSEKGDFEITEGDSYLIGKAEKYYITGDNLSLTATTTPKWTPGQHKSVD